MSAARAGATEPTVNARTTTEMSRDRCIAITPGGEYLEMRTFSVMASQGETRTIRKCAPRILRRLGFGQRDTGLRRHRQRHRLAGANRGGAGGRGAQKHVASLSGGPE